MLKKFGGNVICMDSTHGTNAYQFLLISIMVLDDFGEGIPVAWAISNKEDTSSLVLYLTAVKEQVGNIEPTVFMSDDADAFYNAWQIVFGGETRRLLCFFHVDRAWRKNLSEHIKEKQDLVETYHQLRTLLTETDKSKFHVLLQQFISLIHQKFPGFYSYFSSTYAKRAPIWATCYRVGTVVNTNMHLESFHRRLKVVYLESKQNRRLDHLLHVLLKISRDLIFESFRKFEIGKLSHRKCEIRRRHLRAQDLDPGLVHECDGEWTVKSNTDKFAAYYVRLERQSCDCKLHCDMCNACVHMYTCSCLDATLHYTVCKHVHLVQMKISETRENVNEVTTTEENEVENDMTTKAQVELPVQHDNQCTNTVDKTTDLEQRCDEQFDESFTDHEQASKIVLMDLEEQSSSININDTQENGDLHGEGSMKDYYSRMLRQDKCINRTATLHGEIETLSLKLNTLQRQCYQPEILQAYKFCHHNHRSCFDKSFTVCV